MKKIKLSIIFIFFLLSSIHPILAAEEQNYKIIKLVNDQVITNYDLQQRIRLYATLNRINVNDENVDNIAKELLLIMVNEKLKLEKINEYGITISKNEINDYIKRAYLGPDKEINDFINVLENNKIDIKILNEIIKVKIGWSNLAGRLYYRTSEVNNDDLATTMQNDPSLTEEEARNILLQKQIDLRAKKLLRDIKAEANIETR